MSRYFGAVTDRIVAAAPAVWPGAAGTIFVRIQPQGWGAGIVGDHLFWCYGYLDGSSQAFLLFERYTDNKVYVGWFGDATHGGDQRIIIPDTGCFSDGVWANHLFTWDVAATQEIYYVDNVQKGMRASALNTQTLAGSATSNVTIGNYNSVIRDADARANVAFFARWDRALSQIERVQLQSGAHPLDLPTGLVECIELGAGSPEQDLQSAVTYVVTGAKQQADPSVPRWQIAELAQRFEPILLFHQDERFFPVDPKWYLERCALWPAAGSFTDKAKWGELPLGVFPRGPRVSKSNLFALAGETPAGSTAGSQWLGAPGQDLGVATVPNEQAPSPTEEFFFEFVGWDPVATPPVDTGTINRHPTLDPAQYGAPLADSRPWYYVEFLSHADLVAFAQNHKPSGLDLSIAILDNATTALLYYFLYPLHQEPLENCEMAGEGQSFATYAGEWGCVALLIDSSGTPRFVGLTSRNVGAPSQVATEDARVGMALSAWTAPPAPVTSGLEQHRKIYVSLGTHGHYLTVGPHPVTPFWGGNDPTRGSCGVIEAADDVISGDTIVTPGDPGHDYPSAWVMIAKDSLPVVGFVWALVEYANGNFGSPAELATPSATPSDQTGGQTGGPATFGRIIRPNGLIFSETASSPWVSDWNVKRIAGPDKRIYDRVVSRPAQVWWAPRKQVASPVEGPGWSGRWGPRVTNDPFNRRAGGKCPDFVVMFLEAVAIALNAP
jgi:hypothetical protein